MCSFKMKSKIRRISATFYFFLANFTSSKSLPDVNKMFSKLYLILALKNKKYIS